MTRITQRDVRTTQPAGRQVRGRTQNLFLGWTACAVLGCWIGASGAQAPPQPAPPIAHRPEAGPTQGSSFPAEARPAGPVRRSDNPARQPNALPSQKLFAAIRQVESGGDDPLSKIVGDGGLSRGPYQISRAYWRDACEHGGMDWSYETYVWNRARCEHVMRCYWSRYGATTDEQRARMHNGGPTGPRKRATLTYWKKVRKQFRKPPA